MGRILAIDFGIKRTGIAVTDPLKIIATGLTTVASYELINFLEEYLSKEDVELILIGDPKNLDESDTHATAAARRMLNKLRRTFRQYKIIAVDERYTSKMASRAMIDMGMKKMQRRNKALIDEIAATIMLKEFLDSQAGNTP